ncbi:MAG: ergothioneine biosynthesis protein EgtB [Vitreoscilla sp.]|nr:ergothioneine biosynthesis protein EgtB [Vitreoscilla sp.]
MNEGRAAWLERLQAVRARTRRLAEPLSAEDQCVQSMPDTSPTKWHLAHTTWFFETLVLQAFAPGHRPVDERYAKLFNSYYESLGPRHPRPQRGLLTRPSLGEVLAYRTAVDEALDTFTAAADADTWARAAPLLDLGLHHEQQHQELLLTDILHLLSLNPLAPAYGSAAPGLTRGQTQGWWESAGGAFDIGHAAAEGFAFDNETPRHEVRLAPFALSRSLVTNREVQAFIADGGYRRAEWWLSDGWATVQAQGWEAPLYWASPNTRFSLQGETAVDPDEPACHLSFYEAAALAAWAGARLPTEFEWEAAARAWGETPHASPAQCFGAVWQWTRSSYDPYPRFRPWSGAVAEYNGKFMVGQLVLRGSSFATPAGHARLSYRNFFPPAARWQFSGLRLARDLDAGL